MGRPGYDPRDLLKLYLYGYLNQIAPRHRRWRIAENTIYLDRSTPRTSCCPSSLLQQSERDRPSDVALSR
jgi:hypothetical protein